MSKKNHETILFSIICLATEYHLGLLKAKLAKYRSELLEPSKKGEKGEGFDVLKSGDARVALIGFPSVGKVKSSNRIEMFNFQLNNYTFSNNELHLISFHSLHCSQH